MYMEPETILLVTHQSIFYLPSICFSQMHYAFLCSQALVYVSSVVVLLIFQCPIQYHLLLALPHLLLSFLVSYCRRITYSILPLYLCYFSKQFFLNLCGTLPTGMEESEGRELSPVSFFYLSVWHLTFHVTRITCVEQLEAVNWVLVFSSLKWPLYNTSLL